jgi:chitodextrinase
VTVSAADDQAVSFVDLVVDGSVVSSSASAPYSFVWSATTDGSHTLQAVAHDAAGNTGTSTPVTAVVPTDTTAPTAPDSLTSSGTTTTSVALSWAAATDDRSVTGYQVLRDGTVTGQVPGLTFTDQGLQAGSTYTYTVRAVDGAGNVGPDSLALPVITASEAPALFSETWAGADGDTWPAGWTASASSATVDTQAGAGRIFVNDVTSAYGRVQLAGLPNRADAELLTSYAWSSNSATSYLSVYLRGSGGWQNGYRPKNGYGLQLQSNSGTVVVQKNVSSVTSTIQSVPSAQQLTTAKQWLRLRVSGSTIEFKIWTDGTPEPVTWKSTIVDSSVSAAGQVFISVNRGASNVGTKSVTFDDLSVRDAQ